MKNNLITNFKSLVLVYMLVIVASLFCINEIYMPSSFFDALMSATFGRMFPIFILLILIVATYKLISFYNKNYIMFLRFKNKGEYLNSLFKYIFINLIIVFFISILMIFIFVLFNHIFYNYAFKLNFLSFIYYLYSVIKIFGIYWLILKISILIYKCYSIKISIIFMMVILILKDGYPYTIDSVSSFSDIPLFYGYYLFPLEYSNIFLDIFSFLLQITVLFIVGEGLKKIIIKYKKIYIED